MDFCRTVLFSLGLFCTAAWAAAPPDQNFDAISPQESPTQNNPTITFDGVEYSADSSNDAIRVDTIDQVTGNLPTLGSGNGIVSIWYGTNTGTYFQFASVNNTDNFKLVSLRAEVWGGSSNTAEVYTVTGYDDGNPVVTATVTFTADGSYGTGNAAIIYDRQTTGAEDSSSGFTANAGLLTFGSAWTNIDQVRFAVADAKILAISMDQINFAEVDVTAPTITSVSSSTANGTYKVGDAVSIQVNFDENVTVTGTPQLTLETGTTDRTVNYSSGSGTSALTFSYTVQAGDLATDLDYTATNALTLNGGDIEDGSANDATLTLASPSAAGSLGANKSIVIDGVAPTVSSVNSSTADGTYKIGDSISVQVDFAEAVTVTGTPQLTLETGTTDRTINYASGSGSSTLTFSYTVQSGDNSNDLDYVATNSLTLNGGTVADGAGNNATLTLASPGAANSLGNNKALMIDGVPPAVTSTAPVGGAVSTDTSVDYTVNFNESVTGISTDDFALGTTGSAAGSISAVSASSGSSVTVTVSSISGNGTIKLNLSGSTNISDAAGNSGPSAYTSGSTHTVAIPTAPDAPTIGVATPGDGQASVAFSAPGNDGGSAITGYTVTSSPGGITAGGNGFTTSPITVTGLTNGTAYTFTVMATNAVGTSAASGASAAVTPKADQTITFANPGAQNFGTTPTLTATSDSGLTVTFTSSTTGVCTITSGGALTFVTAGSCTIDADQAGNASFNAAPTVPQTFTVNAVVPGAPTIGTATAGDTQASVTFSAPGSDGGANISGYTVTSSPGGLTGTGASSPISVTGLTNGVAYTFSVTATNSAGTGSASAASNSVTPAAPQTITFTNPGAQNFGTTPTLTATSTSGLTVTFTSSTTGVCTITSGGVLTFVTVGTCTINADQAGDSSYLVATQVSRSFTVSAVVPGAPTAATATAGDTQASVAFTAPVNTGGTTITGYTVTISPADVAPVNGAGSPIIITGLTNGQAYTFTVTADNSAGTGPASAASNSITPKAAQSITFANPGAKDFGTTPTLTATSDSSLTVTFTSSTTGVCTVTSGGALTFVAVGTCTINADQAGDSSYLAATQVSRSFTVNAVVPGAPVIGTATVAGATSVSLTFNAPASSGGAAITGYTINSSPASTPVNVAGSPATISGLTSGQSYTFTVTATNSVGSGSPSAASNSVTLPVAQTITFANPGAQNFGTTPTLSATADSGLPVTLTSATTGVCTVTGGGVLTFATTGTCTINADQAGDSNYLAATQVSRSFTVNAVVPGAPVIGTATVTGATSVSLTFIAPASNGGATVTGYTINSTPASTPVNVAGSPATISGLTSGQSYTFTVSATNAAGTGSSSSASNAVIPVSLNVAPEISGTPATTVIAGVAYTFTPTASDADAGTTLIFSASNVPVWANFSSSTGTLSGTPAETDVGTSGSIVISVSDGEANASLPAFSITVQTGNKAPVISGTPATSVKAGAAYSFMPSASDADANDTLTFSISNKPGWASFNPVNGNLSGTPVQSDAGVSSGIVIGVSDGKVSASLPAFSIEVLANTAPVATPGSSTLNEDEPASIELGGTDADGDELTVQIQTQPQHGTLTQNGNAWLYTPQQDYHGDDSLSFIVKDATQSSAAAMYNLTITAVNDAPVAVDDALSLPRSSNDQYSLSVLANDQDVDGDILQLTGASASVGTVAISGTSLNFTAPAQYTGLVELKYSVSDGKKGLATAPVSLTITGATNDQLPVITVPADIEVNATALFTRVPLGTATAVDRNGRRLRVSLINGSLFFAPGVHQVYWQATDADGNTATKAQQVRVHPLVSLSKDQVVNEGSSVRVDVLLNGQAVLYPLQVPYTVSGSAGGNDHTLSSGTVEIGSGLSTSLQFEVLEDAVSDNNETITITLGSVNAGSQRSTRVVITENNVAPVLSLNSQQQGENRLTVSRDGGIVTLNAVATDANAGDVLTLTWQSSLTLSGSEANSRSVDPSALTPGVYPVSVTAIDNGSPEKSATAQLYLLVQPALPQLGSGDTDGDLIPDELEGFADADRDGIPDYKDAIDECNVVPEADTEQRAFLAEGEPGACLRRGQQSILATSGGLELGNTEVETDTTAINIGGIFDFIAYGLPQAGQSYQLILPQRLPVPANAVYRKYNDTQGWVEFVTDSKNHIRSALGERGFCPPPGDVAYTEGLTANHWCVQVTVEDGGPNDADGLVNAAIVDPGGVAVPVSSNKLPQAKPDSATTRMNQAVIVKVLANDTDADNDTLSVSQAVANFGTVKIETDGALTYTPAADFVGNDVVIYSINDGNGGTSSSELTVTVRLNNQPVVGADSTATDDRTAISINVLSNDSDADSDPLKVVSASALTGTVSIETDNRLRYTPKAGFNGTDTVSYRVSDGFGGEANGQVTITVTAYQSVTVSNKSSGGAVSALWLTALVLLGLVRRYGVLLLLPLAGAVQAGDWQLQLGAGQSKVSQADTALRQALPAGTVRSIDDSDQALSLSLQYQLFERLDVELGYLDLGEGRADLAADTLTPTQYHQAVRQLTPVLGDGVFAGLRIGLWQQYGWRLQLPLGMYSWKSDLSSTMNGSTLQSETDSTDLYYGLTLQYLHDAHWAAGISWQQIALEPEDVRVLQFTLSYRF